MLKEVRLSATKVCFQFWLMLNSISLKGKLLYGIRQHWHHVYNSIYAYRTPTTSIKRQLVAKVELNVRKRCAV